MLHPLLQAQTMAQPPTPRILLYRQTAFPAFFILPALLAPASRRQPQYRTSNLHLPPYIKSSTEDHVHPLHPHRLATTKQLAVPNQPLTSHTLALTDLRHIPRPRLRLGTAMAAEHVPHLSIPPRRKRPPNP